MKNLALGVLALAAVVCGSSCAGPEARTDDKRELAAAPPAAPASGVAPAAPTRAGVSRRSAASSASTETAIRTAPAAAPRATFEEHAIAAGTTLEIELRTPIASDESGVEDEIRGRLTRPVLVNGVEAFPRGATVRGTITDVERSGRVKGLARVAFRFNALEDPETGSRVSIRTSSIVREAEATKKKDAAKIGGAAAGGAVIGGILGGGDGAAKGAAIGGAAGTGLVLSTRGNEVRLPSGTVVSVRLNEPVVVRLPVQ